MAYSPILTVHICAGTLGLLSGTAAMSFRKGSPRHVLVGKVFVASMLNLLSDRNGMADLQAQRRGNEPFGLGCALDSFGARYPHLDEWS